MKRSNPGQHIKAQVSLEFMFIFVLFVAVLTIAAVYVAQSNLSIFDSRLGLEAEGALSLIKGKLDTAYLEGNGFSTNITLPQDIMGFDYNVSINRGFILVEINNQTYTKILITKNITGTLRKGENRLQNVNQEVVIS